MKKILTVVYKLKKGGTQRTAQNFANAYKELGHNSRILALYELGYGYKEIKNKLKVYKTLKQSTLDDIVAWNPDIIHIHSHGSKAKDIIKFIKYLNQNNSYPKIIEQNVFSIPTAWEKYLDASFQLSYWCQWLYKKRGGDQNKSYIVPNAVKTNNFHPASISEVSDFKKKYNIPENAFVIGRIGQAINTKWCKSIYDVFEGVSTNHNNIYLLLVSCPDGIYKYFEKSKFKENIIKIDFIYGDDNLSAAYSSMDVFYHAAEQGESFGLVIAESILCGTPVVSLSTPWGDNSQIEVVNNNVGGYVVHRPKSAIDVISKLIKNELKYDIEKGRQHIIDSYDYINLSKRAVRLAINDDENSVLEYPTLWDILNKSYDKARYLDLILLSLKIRQLIRITSGYNDIKTFLSKIFKKINI